MIHKNTLRAFGFKRATDTTHTFSDKSYLNKELDIWYDPTHHTDKQFAENFVGSVSFQTFQKLISKMELAKIDTIVNMRKSVLNQE